MPQILQSIYFSPPQQISRMRLTGQIWRDENLQNPSPRQIYVQKIDRPPFHLDS